MRQTYIFLSLSILYPFLHICTPFGFSEHCRSQQINHRSETAYVNDYGTEIWT